MTADSNGVGSSANAATKIVLDYLRSRGYRRAEAALVAELGRDHGGQNESREKSSVQLEEIALDNDAVDDDLRNSIMVLRNPERLVAETDPGRYYESYCELRDWVDGSLDLYKAELHSVLYPLLVHCFLEMVRREFPEKAREFLANCSSEFAADPASSDGSPGRREELISLAGVSSRQHLEENETAALFLNNRYELYLSSYAFELIISFLADDPRRVVLLRILNMRCRVRLDADADTATRAGIPGPKRDEIASNGFLSAKESTSYIQQNTILWGRLSPSLYLIPDEEESPGLTSAENRSTAGPGTGAKPGSGAGDKHGRSGDVPVANIVVASSSEKVTSDAKDGGVDEKMADVPHVRPDGTLSESPVPLKRYRIGAAGLETEEDIRSRAPLGLKQQSPVPVQENNNIMKEDGIDQVNTITNISDELCTFLLPSVLCYTFTNTIGEGLNCTALTPDGSQIAAGFGDSSVRYWDAKATGTAERGAGGFGNHGIRLIGHSGPVYGVDWTNCGRFILSGSEDGTVRLWNCVTQTDLVAFRGHNYPVWSVGFSPLGHYFCSGSHDRTARIWVTDRVYPLRILAGHLADVDVLRWHPNCNYVATGSSDRTARLWDVRDGTCVRVFGLQNGAVQALSFSPDGRSLAIAGEGRVIEVWDIIQGKILSKLEGHTQGVWSLDFSREGSLLASGSGDCTVRLWRTDTWCAHAGAESTDNRPTESTLKSNVLLTTLRTKKTPIQRVSFTRRNLLVAAGAYSP